MWRELLERVYESLHDDAKPHPEVQKMAPPEFASLLEAQTPYEGDESDQRTEFAARVQQALYRDLDWPLMQELTADNARTFVERIEQRNATLRAVSAMCVRRGPVAFEPNSQVKAVVTFNLDNLLQAHSRAKYCKKYGLNPTDARSENLILRTVERPSASSRLNKISVYHMHGMIRFDKGMADREKHAPDQMVLTEQDYFNTFNNPTSVFNYAFLHLLREHTAVFIGLSMHDENLRRLLHYSKQERKKAFEAERVQRPIDEINLRVRRHVALLPSSGEHGVDEAYEDTLAPLGVHVIWIDDYGEIPTLLQEVYGTKEAWGSVYD